MAKLTAAQRKRVPPTRFGMPPAKGRPGKYPMPDKSHAGNAKARASEMEHKGKISKSTEAKIDAKANKVLKK